MTLWRKTTASAVGTHSYHLIEMKYNCTYIDISNVNDNNSHFITKEYLTYIDRVASTAFDS